MSKFTPGPWALISSMPRDGLDYFSIKAQPNGFMRGFTMDIAAILGPQIRNEHEANARLIAAAPDLYYVVELVSELGEVLGQENAVVRLARQALNKATGA